MPTVLRFLAFDVPHSEHGPDPVRMRLATGACRGRWLDG